MIRWTSSSAPLSSPGEKLRDDYCVFHEGRRVGRIMLARERSLQGVVWEWHSRDFQLSAVPVRSNLRIALTLTAVRW